MTSYSYLKTRIFENNINQNDQTGYKIGKFFEAFVNQTKKMFQSAKQWAYAYPNSGCGSYQGFGYFTLAGVLG